MITHISCHHDHAIADFWVEAWQQTFPAIDFAARRAWLLGHVEYMRRAEHIVRGYFDGDKPVGFYSLFKDSGLIEQICVNPRAKGRGIGAALIADGALQTDQLLNLVVNDDNKTARRFYGKLGFVKTGRGVNAMSSRPTISLQMTAKTAP